MKKVRVGYGQIAVIDREYETDLAGITVSENGVDTTVKADVIAVGADIEDIIVGDVVTYPRSRGVSCFHEEQEIKVIQYLSVLFWNRD